MRSLFFLEIVMCSVRFSMALGNIPRDIKIIIHKKRDIKIMT
jgi:hypothetical protein